MKVVGIILMILVLAVLAGSIMFIYQGITIEYGVEEVPCYDKLGNEILGVTCEKVTDWKDSFGLVIVGGLFMIFGVGMGYFGWATGDLE